MNHAVLVSSLSMLIAVSAFGATPALAQDANPCVVDSTVVKDPNRIALESPDHGTNVTTQYRFTIKIAQGDVTVKELIYPKEQMQPFGGVPNCYVTPVIDWPAEMPRDGQTQYYVRAIARGPAGDSTAANSNLFLLGGVTIPTRPPRVGASRVIGLP